MTIGSVICIAIIVFLGLKSRRNFSINMLLMAIFCSAFIQRGLFLNVLYPLDYYQVPLYIFIAIELFGKKHSLKLGKNTVMALLLLCLCVVGAYFSLILG